VNRSRAAQGKASLSRVAAGPPSTNGPEFISNIACNIHSLTNTGVIVPLHIVEKSAQRRDAAWNSCKAAV
jgi:hypothetical protein